MAAPKRALLAFDWRTTLNPARDSTDATRLAEVSHAGILGWAV